MTNRGAKKCSDQLDPTFRTQIHPPADPSEILEAPVQVQCASASMTSPVSPTQLSRRHIVSVDQLPQTQSQRSMDGPVYFTHETRDHTGPRSEHAPREYPKMETRRSKDSPMSFKGADSVDQPSQTQSQRSMDRPVYFTHETRDHTGPR
ncbi:hypothetical protein NQD34_011595 [Periophthalmus magnuspinnatus]|nr:hypothetical protein NQD34_011595 [Periophthalmus magnuspinnatus]